MNPDWVGSSWIFKEKSCLKDLVWSCSNNQNWKHANAKTERGTNTNTNTNIDKMKSTEKSLESDRKKTLHECDQDFLAILSEAPICHLRKVWPTLCCLSYLHLNHRTQEPPALWDCPHHSLVMPTLIWQLPCKHSSQRVPALPSKVSPHGNVS